MIFLLINEVDDKDVTKKYQNTTFTTSTTPGQNHQTKLSPPLLLWLEDKEERTKHKVAPQHTHTSKLHTHIKTDIYTNTSTSPTTMMTKVL